MENEIIFACLALSVMLSIILWILYTLIKLFKWQCYLSDIELTILHVTLLASSLTFLWYSLSLSLTLYNKWLLQQWHYTGFNFPSTVTAAHMVIKLVLTRVWKFSIHREPIKEISTRDFLLVVMPIGLLTVCDIAMSNMAITLLPLSIFTIVKSANLIFIFLFGVLFRIESSNIGIALTILGILVGIAVSVGASGQLNTFGMVVAVSSSAAGGLRWVCMKMLIDLDPESKDVMVTLYRFIPFSVISVVPFAIVTEFPTLLKSAFILNDVLFNQTLLLVLAGGALACGLIFTEIHLLRITSSLSMGVIGQIKEVLQILIAMFLFQDKMSLRSALGIALSIASSYCYRRLRLHETRSLAMLQSKLSNGQLQDEVDETTAQEMVPLTSDISDAISEQLTRRNTASNSSSQQPGANGQSLSTSSSESNEYSVGGELTFEEAFTASVEADLA